MERKLGQFDSWIIESDEQVVKKCDKSFFDYRGSGIPANIRWFFDVDQLEQGEKLNMVLSYEGGDYPCYISRETNDTARTRIFWDTSLSAKIKQKEELHLQHSISHMVTRSLLKESSLL